MQVNKRDVSGGAFEPSTEIFQEVMRRFQMLDYMKTTGILICTTNLVSLVLFPLSMKAQHLGLERFRNGAEMGAYASFTDVSFDEYGEGSFDKGVFFIRLHLGVFWIYDEKN